ncbi:hypothetical protein KKH38_00335 [Patescibacteria group bacterium]|nr:hypothetical protein [Patescibacteria group bacterium]MBU4601273.1 hypothetical protein [Patescibacteria group bacterium]MCG2698083.1 hypothetical protein [Candidatus Parcubacteria bacterium]
MKTRKHSASPQNTKTRKHENTRLRLKTRKHENTLRWLHSSRRSGTVEPECKPLIFAKQLHSPNCDWGLWSRRS